MDRYSAQYNGGGRPDLPVRLLDAFYRYSWPGNVRQLENVIKRFLILHDEELILSELADNPRD